MNVLVKLLFGYKNYYASLKFVFKTYSEISQVFNNLSEILHIDLKPIAILVLSYLFRRTIMSLAMELHTRGLRVVHTTRAGQLTGSVKTFKVQLLIRSMRLG